VEELLRVLEEVHDLEQLFLRLLRARDVRERHALRGIGRVYHPRFRLPEGERLHARAAHLAREEPEQDAQEEYRDEYRREVEEPVLEPGLALYRDADGGELLRRHAVGRERLRERRLRILHRLLLG